MAKDRFSGLNRSVDDFRRWVLCDWKSPTTRALLAEYYVRCALGADSEQAEDFEYVDIVLRGGRTIEVKASAYLQPTKDGLKRTAPKFSIGKKTWAWNTRLWNWMPEPEAPRRWADCYVLCLENMEDPKAYNPLDLSKWEFFVLSTPKINETFGDQQTLSVYRLRKEGFCSVAFDSLASEISQKMQP